MTDMANKLITLFKPRPWQRQAKLIEVCRIISSWMTNMAIQKGIYLSFEGINRQLIFLVKKEEQGWYIEDS